MVKLISCPHVSFQKYHTKAKIIATRTANVSTNWTRLEADFSSLNELTCRSELGGYWSKTQPNGPIQSIIDSALDQTWGNKATQWVSIDLPAGTTFYEGIAASQRGLVGGGNQVYLTARVESSWITGRGNF